MTRFIIESLLSFLDNPDIADRKHASSIVGVIGEDLAAGVYVHYRKLYVHVLHEENVTEGNKGGKWLDRWIADDGNKILYQCEIKSWSASAIGGHNLDIDAPTEEIKRVASHYMMGLNKNFVSEQQPNHVTKVLKNMKPLKGVDYTAYTVKPLLIVWMPVMNESEILTPSFEIRDLPEFSEFDSLEIFSVSLYLRELLAVGIKEIEIDAPSIKRRMSLLNGFIAT